MTAGAPLGGGPPVDLELFHVGFVVADIHQARHAYGQAFGYRWSPVVDRHLDLLVDGERRRAELRLAYSLQGPPHVELIEEVSGDLWGPRFLGIDHVGYWATSFGAAVEHLHAHGFPAVVRNLDPEGTPTRFTYHRTPSGRWMEVVDRAAQPEIARWLAAGTGPADGADTVADAAGTEGPTTDRADTTGG